MNKCRIKKQDLHFAIPVSLFLLGLACLFIGFYFIACQYSGYISFIFKGSCTVSAAKRTTSSVQHPNKNTIPAIVYSQYGTVMGHLTIKSAGIVNCPVYHGDGNDQLRKGIGQFVGGKYPGEGGKIILDAHRETFFHNLRLVKSGDKVGFTTIYGQYIYKVYDIKILPDTETSIIAPDSSQENLEMYTCYPFDTIGYHPKRYVVYAKLVSGTKVKIPKF